MARISTLRKESLEAALQHGIDVVSRKVFLHGDVGEDTIGTAIRGIYLLAELANEPIELYVSSYGGNLEEAFALHDVTRTVRVPIHTVALGKCQSAAPMVVASGAQGERYATENTTFMLHDAQVYPPDSPDYAANLAATCDLTARMMDRYASLLARYSNKDRRHWKRIFAGKVDRFFDAEQALEWGLIDTIWSEKD